MKKINMNEAVSAKELDWVEACQKAAKNDDFFQIFRSSKPFLRVIEGTPASGGIWNLRRLLKEKDFIKSLPLIQKSDLIGLPRNMIDFTITNQNNKKRLITNYSLSPITIRYANNAINSISLFGKDIINGKTEIYEIGSGYGGECKIFNDLSVTLCGSKIGERWHIYDLATSIGIIKRFLSYFKYSADFSNLSSSQSKIARNSLVISNGAFSEMRGSLLTEYFNSIIVNAKYGYFITNFETHSAPYGGWTTEEFIKRLKGYGKKDVTVLPTLEYLSYFDYQAGSKLVVFGHRQTKKNRTNIKDIVWINLFSKLSYIMNYLKSFFLKRS